MRIEWKDTNDIENIGQFIVYAENDMERAIIRRFADKNHSKDWRFWFHGACYNMNHDGPFSFNFGFIRNK